MMQRPQTTVILAMSADGKVSDSQRSHAAIGSKEDWDHLERQVALADAVLLGAQTVRASGSAMRVIKPELIQQRRDRSQSEQPIHIICSRSGSLAKTMRFFQQPVPRWLVTTQAGAEPWQGKPQFDQVLVFETSGGAINWEDFFRYCQDANLESIAVLGGGMLIASLLEGGWIDSIWLTICPVLLGGARSPTPFDGIGFSQDLAPRLLLLESHQIGDELFLHYQLKASDNTVSVTSPEAEARPTAWAS